MPVGHTSYGTQGNMVLRYGAACMSQTHSAALRQDKMPAVVACKCFCSVCTTSHAVKMQHVADDPRRPWVGQEKERFKRLLRNNGLPVHEHRYFDGDEPTLLMHFQAIEAMQRLG